MRKFMIGAVLYAVLFCGWGTALEIDEAVAEAPKTVLAKCARSTPKVPYPHWKHTRVACQNPGWWVRVWAKFARRIGTYPVVIGTSYGNRRHCRQLPPKVSARIGRSEAISSWVLRRACVKAAIQ